MSEALRCPTCRAPWHGVTICPRCGSDLAALMRVAAKAWELREAARAALCAGDRPAYTLDLARAACRLHATPQSQRLLALALVAAGQMAEALDVTEQPPGPHGGNRDHEHHRPDDQ
jgi:predicted amidophosphoribosyltransferase